MRTRLVGMLVAVVVLGPAGWADITGQVVDPDGKPVAGATVEAASFDWPRSRLAGATTHPDGSFVVRLPEDSQGVVVAASAPGWALGWRYCALPATGLQIRLAPPTELRLPVVDEHGQPVAGLPVRIYGVWPPGGGEPYRIPQGGGRFETRTGADGVARIPGLPQGGWCRVAVADERYTSPDYHDPYQVLESGPVSSAPPIRTMRKATVRGRVVFRDTGMPAAGADILCETLSLKGDAKAVTDAHGRYRLENVTPGICCLVARPAAAHRARWASAVLPALTVLPGREHVNQKAVLTEGTPLTVKVTDRATSKPVRGARIVITGAQCPFHAAYTSPGFTNAQGLYTELVLPGPQRVHVDDRDDAPRFSASYTERSLRGKVNAGVPVLVTFTLAPAKPAPPIQVIVLGPDGKPAPDAVVEVRSVGDLTPGTDYPVPTDANGTLRIADLWSLGDVRLRARLGDQGTLESTPAKPGDSVVLHLADHVLGSVAVKVTDVWGRPIRAASVRLEATEPSPGGRWSRGVHLYWDRSDTDANGEATFTGCWPIAGYSLEAEAAGYGHRSSATFSVRPGEHVEATKLLLPAATATLRGRVVDARNRPVGLAEVTVYGGQNAFRRCLTGLDGLFQFDGLVPGPVRIGASDLTDANSASMDTTTELPGPTLRLAPSIRLKYEPDLPAAGPARPPAPPKARPPARPPPPAPEPVQAKPPVPRQPEPQPPAPQPPVPSYELPVCAAVQGGAPHG